MNAITPTSMVTPTTPTTHTPPGAGEHQPRGRRERWAPSQTGKGARLVTSYTQHIRLLTQRCDRLAPYLPGGHSGRLESALMRTLADLEKQVATLEKWDRARGYTPRGTDSAELRSIDEGGNG